MPLVALRMELKLKTTKIILHLIAKGCFIICFYYVNFVEKTVTPGGFVRCEKFIHSTLEVANYYFEKNC